MTHSLAPKLRHSAGLVLCAVLVACGPQAPQLAIRGDAGLRPDFAERSELLIAGRRLTDAQNPSQALQARIARLSLRAQSLKKMPSAQLLAQIRARRRASGDIRAELRKSLQ